MVASPRRRSAAIEHLPTDIGQRAAAGASFLGVDGKGPRPRRLPRARTRPRCATGLSLSHDTGSASYRRLPELAGRRSQGVACACSPGATRRDCRISPRAHLCRRNTRRVCRLADAHPGWRGHLPLRRANCRPRVPHLSDPARFCWSTDARPGHRGTGGETVSATANLLSVACPGVTQR
jgi:hypothetical protein